MGGADPHGEGGADHARDRIIEWGKPLEARDYPYPEPQGERCARRGRRCLHSDVHIGDGMSISAIGKQISLESRGVNLRARWDRVAGEVVARRAAGRGVKVVTRSSPIRGSAAGECAVCKQGEELLCSTRSRSERRAAVATPPMTCGRTPLSDAAYASRRNLAAPTPVSGSTASRR